MTAPLFEQSTVPIEAQGTLEDGIDLWTAPEVVLMDVMGSDQTIVNAARVSTLADTPDFQAADTGRNAGLINYLMEYRHGSPFEHGAATFYVKCPIGVTREFMRHRIGFSYNEMSSRYTVLHPEFYVPAPERPLANVGTSARPVMAAAPHLYDQVVIDTVEAYEFCWAKYKKMIDYGAVKEIARNVLPVGIYTQFYVTCNPRSIMAFLSLRTSDPESRYPSAPLYEIEQVARAMEEFFAAQWPTTYAAFVKHGRVGP